MAHGPAVNAHDWVWVVDAEGNGENSGRDEAATKAEGERLGYRHARMSTANHNVYPGMVVDVSYGPEGSVFKVLVLSVRREFCKWKPLTLGGWGDHPSAIFSFCGVAVDFVTQTFNGPFIPWESLALVPRNDTCLRILEIFSDNIKTAETLCATINFYGGIRDASTGKKAFHMVEQASNFSSTDANGNF
jgi:hypothetical protein